MVAYGLEGMIFDFIRNHMMPFPLNLFIELEIYMTLYNQFYNNIAVGLVSSYTPHH